MSEKNNLWLSLLEYSRWYPSPHNTQPIKVKILNNSEAEIYFVQNRGLRVGDPKGRFTFLTFGIFVEILKIAAGHKGYELKTEFIAREIYISQEKMEKIANLKLVQKKELRIWILN